LEDSKKSPDLKHSASEKQQHSLKVVHEVKEAQEKAPSPDHEVKKHLTDAEKAMLQA